MDVKDIKVGDILWHIKNNSILYRVVTVRENWITIVDLNFPNKASGDYRLSDIEKIVEKAPKAMQVLYGI